MTRHLLKSAPTIHPLQTATRLSRGAGRVRFRRRILGFRAHTRPWWGDWWLALERCHRAFISPVVDHEARKVKFAVTTSETEHPESPAKTRCLLSGAPITFDYIRAEGRLGHLGSR